MKNLVVVAFLALVSGAVQAEVLNCGGTEPFWSLTINEEERTVDYSNFGSEEVDSYKKLEVAIPMNDTSIRNFQAKKGLGGRKKVNAIVLVTDGDIRSYCSDGMSDFNYQYEIVLNVDGQTLQGCCESSKRPRRGGE